MINGPGLRACLIASACFAALATRPARAVNIVIDYRYDTLAMGGSNFFGRGNPHGSVGGLQARASIEAAADYFSLILNDSLAAIETPESFTSAVFGTTATFDWSINFTSPGSGDPVAIMDPTIAADEYRIYVGARVLEGGTLAEGGPGGVQRGLEIHPDGGSFTQHEASQVMAARDAFFSAVDNRDNPGQFGNWGGSITFDRDLANWNLDHTRVPDGDQLDFYSVALHEIPHTLGFGGSDEFLSFVDDDNRFTGAAATAVYGDAVPLDNDLTHWDAAVNTTVFGTDKAQPSVLDRLISPGKRQLFGAVDAAALTDLGWEFVPPSFLEADFDFDTLVNAVDRSIWEDAFASTAQGDADGDSDTDGADWLILARQFGQHANITTFASPVPEPSSILLSAGASLYLLIRTAPRRRGR